VASIRINLLLALRDRIDAITGTTCALRDTENDFSETEATAIVYPEGESKSIGTQEQYQASYQTEVLLVCKPELADPVLDEGNAFVYLDRKLTEIEKVVHNPDEWGDVDVTDVEITGHTVEDPGDGTEVAARIFIAFQYRHHYQDPET
jgi:hypothetical protein